MIQLAVFEFPVYNHNRVGKVASLDEVRLEKSLQFVQEAERTALRDLLLEKGEVVERRMWLLRTLEL